MAGLTGIELSADDARRLALAAQQLSGAPDRRAGPAGLVQSLGAVQLDTISVLARSHELVAYARLGAIGRATIEAAYWGGDCFEYWAHAACVLPLTHWPLFAFRRRHYAQRERLWERHGATTTKTVLARVRDEGPMTATELGGAKKTADWWGWSDIKASAEFLIATGELICTRRVGWRRIYDLPERVLPAAAQAADLDDDACMRELIRLAARALGVATLADVADYYRLKRADVARLIGDCGLVPVTVAGWREQAWADPGAMTADLPRGRHRTTLLSPFDSLVWDRRRTARIFGLDHRLEAYVPKPLRQHGYFAMPVLAGGHVIGRIDPARVGDSLVARQVTIVPSYATPARLTATARAISDGAARGSHLGRTPSGERRAGRTGRGGRRCPRRRHGRDQVISSSFSRTA